MPAGQAYPEGLRHKLFSSANFSGFFESGPYSQTARHGS